MSLKVSGRPFDGGVGHCTWGACACACAEAERERERAWLHCRVVWMAYFNPGPKSGTR